MSDFKTPFTPPTLESQYRHVHPSNLPAGRLAEMREQIAQQGVYVGEVMPFSDLTGAVEVNEPTHPGGLLKIMPNVVDLPADHPVRQGSGHERSLHRVMSYIVQLPSRVPETRTVTAEHKRAPAASPEEVQAVGTQAEMLVRTRGQAWEYAPHIRSYKVPVIPRDAVPEAAHQYLGFGDAQIDCEVVTDSRNGKTSVKFRQLSAPSGYPGYFKDSVTYDLSGEGERVTEATFMNTQILLEAPNPDHPSGSAPIEQPEAHQLGRLLSTFEAIK